METTAVRERPVLFSGPMVKAILDGKKSQTRRVVKPQPEKWIDTFIPSMSPGCWIPEGVFIKDYAGFLGKGPLEVRQTSVPCRCPYGTPGDRLWVRESWAIDETKSQEEFNRSELILYRADGERTGVKWHPSIHMPRWASRLTLEITDVRVQRLNEISEEDARAEGVVGWRGDRKLGCKCGACCLEDFVDLWDSINGKSHQWASNPWVWAISFKRLDE